MERPYSGNFERARGCVCIPKKGSDGQHDEKVPGQWGVFKGEGRKRQLRLGNYAAKAEWTGELDFKREAMVQRPAETKFTARSGWLKRLNSALELGQLARVGMPKAGSSGRH
ncbi:hypothetical protein CYMTET_14529 [Cymbomonas tetramitiformis]|uniref:Uncharacterized protein n=1 Tax=Cymbomonas tetramitiformis TaxID=36881 RepID=A0AAE0GFX3_9CHLO|nr:hypothetical protein CYMTET_14529 [Cymbomonas tetramitiformis]